MEIIIYKNECLTLSHDATRHLGRAVWVGFISGETFRSALATCLQFIEEKKPFLWLADNRKMKAIRRKDQEWFEKEIMPRLGASSIQRMATLISEDIFNQMAVEDLYSRSNTIISFDHQFFKNEEQAMAWLISQQQEIKREA